MKKVLVFPPCLSKGNVGDQALIDTVSFLLENEGIPYEVYPYHHKKISPEDYFCCVIFGNDILAYYDGFWMKQAVVNFLNSGKKVFTINCSYGKNIVQNDLNQFLQHPDFHLYMRDRFSIGEIRKQFSSFSNAPVLVADIAHLCNTTSGKKEESLKSWIEKNKKKIIGLNVHRDYKELNEEVWNALKEFISKNKEKYRFLLVPHDSREHAKEKELGAKLLQESGAEDYYVCDYLKPEVEKEITQNIHILISCRMHLGILTIPHGIPAVYIEYNGFKCEGTLEHWSIPEFSVKASNVKSLQANIEELEKNYSEYTKKISNSRNEVFKKAYKPIEDIKNYYRLKKTPHKEITYANNFDYDMKNFMSNCMTSNQRNYSQMSKTQLLADLTIDYHRIEKGLAMQDVKPNFGVESGVLNRLYAMVFEYLTRSRKYSNYKESDIILSIVYDCIVEYKQWHSARNISTICNRIDVFIKEFSFLKRENKVGGTKIVSKEHVLNNCKVPEGFFYERRSVRAYSEEDIDIKIIEKCVDKALYGTPTVCNRNINKVVVVKDPALKREILSLQNGNRGFGEHANTILIAATDLQAFQDINERKQPYIGGGMFSMSLIYALYSEGIATCSLNWDVDHKLEEELKKKLGLQNHAVMMYIAAGYQKEQYPVAISTKLTLDEVILKVH